MKTTRKLASKLGVMATLSLSMHGAGAPLSALSMGALGAAFAVGTLEGCADENDPKTWVKRLDDPAQRASAIKRLAQFFEDTMTKANKNRDDATVKALLDDIVEPMTRQYTAGTLDEKTRKELIKFLADTRDPRSSPALAKAFNEYEPGRNDEDVKFAAQAIGGMTSTGKAIDQNLVDALWNVFSKFQVSKAKSINLVKDLHDAVVAVKHPSYAPKCVEKLAAPVDPKSVDSVRDQLQYWQLTSVQLLSELKYTPAVKPLVVALLTPTKADLRAPINTALMRMPKEAEPVLLAAFKGTDPDLAKLTEMWPEKSHIQVLADSISWLSRPAGRDAVLAALATAETDANRAVLAQSLYRFAPDPRTVPAFLAAYNKLPPTATLALMGGANARSVLVSASPQLYDPALTDWVLKEVNGAKGDFADAVQLLGLEAATKLCPPDKVKAVGDAVAKLGTPREKEIFKLASAVLDRCKQDVSCYLKVLDEPIPSSPKTAGMSAIKASWMAAMYGNTGTRAELVKRLDKVKESGPRLALVEAIDHLANQGDQTAATELEKIVDADKASGNKDILMADDAVVKVALMLRSRAMP